MNAMSSIIYAALEWITRFAYLNLLWIVFTLAGGILFGFFPSTTAMFAVSREWLKGNTDKPVLQTFWNYYRTDFWKSNRLGLFVALIGLLIALDIFYIQSSTELVSWTYIPLFAFMLLNVLFLFYLFPSFVHYDIKVRSVIKNAFLLMLINPINNILILLTMAPLYFLMSFLPALLVIFGGSAYAFITMWFALHAFNKANKASGKVEDFSK
ncbi:YesL family protein [Planococcus shixiaomingii]|uniref:YesL family protein n=1 Tax=Planococcus shixiaomingii TaxID=3058393 RepID=UPI00263864D3|nr:YesL family protein [Planococcus sp. N022]WKA55396.1 YesL family protein [Planococcus sp. N022]